MWGGVISLYIFEYKKDTAERDASDLDITTTALFVFLLLIVFLGVFSLGNTNEDSNLVHIPNHVKSFIPRSLLLIAVVLLTSVFVYLNSFVRNEPFILRLPFIALLGTMSYSVFLWHQPIIAFCRYLSYPDISLSTWAIVFTAVLFVSWFSYKRVEKKVYINILSRIITILSFVIINAFALAIYAMGGVVRDVPELYITHGKTYELPLIEYNDRVNSMDIDFPKSDNLNVLVIGNSFARDWVNVMLESEVKEMLNISYVNDMSDSKNKLKRRLPLSDYVFIFDWKNNVPGYLWDSLRPETEVWGIGTKSYGKHNGVIYKYRNKAEYFTKSMKIDHRYYLWNEQLKNEWGEKYIDLLSLSTVRGENVYVFTDDSVFISPDCRHLSRGGAQFFAKKINWNFIFNKEKNDEDN